MIENFDTDIATVRADSNTNKVYVVAKFDVTPDTLIDTMAELTASVCGAVKWLENQ